MHFTGGGNVGDFLPCVVKRPGDVSSSLFFQREKSFRSSETIFYFVQDLWRSMSARLELDYRSEIVNTEFSEYRMIK